MRKDEPLEEPGHKTIVCPSCFGAMVLSSEFPKKPTRFCIYCGCHLSPQTELPSETHHSQLMTDSIGSPTLVPGHLPEQEPIKFEIGSYKIIKKIGKGGMGEVFLAYDTSCGRRIALKRIRADLSEHEALFNRFLKEARITSQLTHPAIIPIYSIHSEGELIYYTMPHVEGKTLKQMLRHVKNLERRGKHPSYGSIPFLVRHFISICQAIAYAHSKGVLHRDIKPENIIIGRFGEVVILDWGLAKLLDAEEDEFEEGSEKHPLHTLTNLGKVVGTLSYMAPERAHGEVASYLTDIYALGVILYQILTLTLPFKRKSLKEYVKSTKIEKLYAPEEVAPYREVPKTLSKIVEKCLNPDPKKRFQTVEELTHELENFIEGRSEWIKSATLRIHEKRDWEFQEHVLLSQHAAITRQTDEMGWFNLMLSEKAFSGNSAVDVKVKLKDQCQGIGIMMGVPAAQEREKLNEGYCLWLSSDLGNETKIARSGVDVYHEPELSISRNHWHHIRVEKVDHSLFFYLNGHLQFSYISHQPLPGPHIGVLLRDDHLEIKELIISQAGQNVTVNCLAVPDAFFAHKDYDSALLEYRRIGESFPGRAEGREALFRAGVTLLEEAKSTKEVETKQLLYDLAMEEFEKLHDTPGAPLEYLGKASIYESLGEFEEEVKCFELAYRRYPNHPLLPILQEQIIYRMHESSMSERAITYHFALLVTRLLPEVAVSPHAKRLFESIQKDWEPLPFIIPFTSDNKWEMLIHFSTQIAFHLGKQYTLTEIIEQQLQRQRCSIPLISNALFCLIELGLYRTAEDQIQIVDQDLVKTHRETKEWEKVKTYAMYCVEAKKGSSKEYLFEILPNFASHSSIIEQRTLSFLIRQCLREEATGLEPIFELAHKMPISGETRKGADILEIWYYFSHQKLDKVEQILMKYPITELTNDKSHLFLLYGIWLFLHEGKEAAMNHFQRALSEPYPRSPTLASHFIAGKLDISGRWEQNAFIWEKRQLYFQLGFFYQCIGNYEDATYWKTLAGTTYLHD